MESESQDNFKSKAQVLAILIIFILMMALFIFENPLLKPTLALKSYGKITMEPELAFHNKKPTFLEFYAEWCEVCREMAPTIVDFKNDYQNDINFVFLNVDNAKWQKYIKQFDVNGIPKIIFFDNNAEIKASLVGLKDEKLINNTLKNLLNDEQPLEAIPVTRFSKIQTKSKDIIQPRSHS